MRVYESKTKNFLYFLYRMVSPVVDPIYFLQGIIGYGWYIRDLIAYKRQDRRQRLLGLNLYPALHDKTALTPFDAHYFYQQLWVFEHILRHKPAHHVDIASTYQMSGYISMITKATFIDLRPIKTSLVNLRIKKGDITSLPFADNSIPSLSCLSVAEHIGLGRYGDPIDPDGTQKACSELSRVLAPKGFLYLSIPIGKERICFNAHRIFSPNTVRRFFPKLSLVSFSVVDDGGKFQKNVNYGNCRNLHFGCGMFMFSK